MHLEALKSEQQRILPNLKKFTDFYLVGGTALALQIGHRISVDFDLFSDREIPSVLLNKVRKVFAGFKVITIINHAEQLSVHVGNTRVDFVKYSFPLISKLKVFNGIKILTVKEIAAMKAYTLGRRGTFKDYVDLYFILKDGYATLEEIKRIAGKKYKSEFNFRLFLEQLIYLEDIKDVEIEFLKQEVNKNKLQNFFNEKVRKFGGVYE